VNTAKIKGTHNAMRVSGFGAVRNVWPAFNTRLGVFGGVMYAGMDTMLRGRVPWTLRHHKRDGVSDFFCEVEVGLILRVCFLS
jgi:hypothetical protein